MKYSLLAFAVTAACTSAHVYANTSEFIDSASTEVITVIGSSLTDNTVEVEREAVSAATNIDADFGDQLALLPGVSISRNGPVTALFNIEVCLAIEWVYPLTGSTSLALVLIQWTRHYLTYCQSLGLPLLYIAV